MKIGFLAEANSIHTVRWITYLKDKGHNVFLITGRINSNLDIKQYKLSRGLPLYISSKDSAFRYSISPWSIYNVKKILKKERPDILHAHYISSYGYIAAQTNFQPLVLTAWGSDVLINPKQYYGILNRMVKFALKKATIVTCDAFHIQDKLKELGTEKVEMIYFGTDIKKFKPIKNKGGIHPMVVSLRNLEPLYDIETLIRAIPKVLKEYPETKFGICGDGSLLGYLNELVKSLGINENTHFVGKVRYPERYLQDADIYVSTSTSDAGLSASTAEAMSCRLPVVITDFGDNKRWVTNGVNGYVFSIGDSMKLSKHIMNLIENKQLREDMGKVNRKIITSKLNQDKEMNKMIKLYCEILND